MAINAIAAGKDVPNDINVVIEIPAQCGPVKYEMDKDSGALFVDRFMSTAMYYPCNYGYIPQTLSGDGDPCDVLVLTPYPLMGGAVINCRPITMLKMVDESGNDAKILAVPNDKIAVTYRDVHSADDIDASLLKTIEHFFTHYKDLEPNKWAKVDGWGSCDDAREEIIASVARYKD